MKKTILFLLLASIHAALPAQQTWPLTAAVDSIVLNEKYRPDQPGFSVMVIFDGKVVYERQRGMANLEKGLRIGPATMFNVGSVTKQFTAAAILLLEKRGLLDLHDPVQKHLPELPDFGATVTLRHLLGHVSGIPDHFEVAVMQGRYKDKLCDFGPMVKKLRAAPALSFQPGSDFIYCNTAYMLLAMVVERVSGLSMHEFCVKNIFGPLGMNSTNFFQKEADGLPDGTTSYEFQPKTSRFKHTKPTPNALGATGVQTTMHDFFRWDQSFYTNELGIAKEMETTGSLLDGSPTNYGAGLLLKSFGGHRMVSHGGGWSSFLMEHRRFPGLGLSVVVMSNNDFSSPFPLADAICERVLPRLSPPAAFRPTGLPAGFSAKDFEGNYLSASNLVRSVRLGGDTVFVVNKSVATGKETLFPIRFFKKSEADGSLVFLDEKGMEVVFKLDAAGRPTGFWWAGGHYFQVRRFYEKLGPAAQTGPFLGKYRSKPHRQTIRVRRDGRSGGLKLKPVFFKKYRLEPLGGSAFRVSGENIIIRFSEKGMNVGNDWTNGLRLEKVR